MGISGTVGPLFSYPWLRYRWWRLLRSCNLDPDTVDIPFEEPGPRDFIVCGIPRSGTSLLAALLHQPPQVVTAMEPWDGLRMPPGELFESLRQEIARSGSLSRTRLDHLALASDGAVRWLPDGATTHPLSVDPNYHLGVKWPTYWRYLDRLARTRFVVCVRHPADAIESFGHSGGRLFEGLDYRVAFNQPMNEQLLRATSDLSVRRALLWEYIASRILPHVERANVLVVRYERWHNDPGAQLREIRDFLGLAELQMNVTLLPPASRRSTKSEQLARQHCSSAAALGYHV